MGDGGSWETVGRGQGLGRELCGLVQHSSLDGLRVGAGGWQGLGARGRQVWQGLSLPTCAGRTSAGGGLITAGSANGLHA